MSNPEQPEPDLAALAAALYHRCRNELRLPEALAVRIAGDFYAAMVQSILAPPPRPQWSISTDGTMTPLQPQGQVNDPQTIISRLRDMLGRGQ